MTDSKQNFVSRQSWQKAETFATWLSGTTLVVSLILSTNNFCVVLEFNYDIIENLIKEIRTNSYMQRSYMQLTASKNWLD